MAIAALTKDRKTPGVYVTEFPAFPPSIVGVPTAVPIFIGYTEKASDPTTGQPLYNQAVSIGSMTEFQSYFGGGYAAPYVVKKVDDPKSDVYDFIAPLGDSGPVKFVIHTGSDQTIQPSFNLYVAMQLFYANGGGDCFVISVANYQGNTNNGAGGSAAAVDPKPLVDALTNVAHDVRGPTMIVIPDACLLNGANNDYGDYATVVNAMLTEASTLQDRVAILDLPGVLDPLTSGSLWLREGLQKRRDSFYDKIAPSQDSFSYGVAYAPALQTTVLTLDDVNFANLLGPGSGDVLNQLLTQAAKATYKDAALKQVLGAVAAAFPASKSEASNGSALTPYPKLPVDDNKKALYNKTLNNYLLNALPLYKQIQQILLDKLNIAPPSGAIAGVWSRNDADLGVWNAPANRSLAGVVAPMVLLNDKDQEDYNVPLNGEAINIVRAFPGRGAVVWGARTLDGNSLDNRYIQVRRTLIYIEQSIKIALQNYVFAPNDAGTWSTVVGSITNFLTNLWQAGGLMGDKPQEAFGVQCGLGSTMTGLDVLNGYMIVSVTLQMVHPAEFIELTFKQTMQGV